MLNKKKLMGKMALKVKMNVKERLEQTEETFVSKKKGSIFKQSAKKTLTMKINVSSTPRKHDSEETELQYQGQSGFKKKSKKPKDHLKYDNGMQVCPTSCFAKGCS